MNTKINISPVAFESFGVRSMCTYAETPDIKVLLDAGVSLSPNRYGLPPHPIEYKVLQERRKLMLKIAEEADIVTISHYHFDHHTPSFTDWVCNWTNAKIAQAVYKGKIVFAKSHRSKINPSQRRRGWMFAKFSERHASRLEYVDGRAFRFGDTIVKFSSPIFHGQEGSPLGWVLMTSIQYEGEKILFAPDVQGPMYKKALKEILAEGAQLVIVGGPPIYLTKYNADRKEVDSAINNLKLIVEKTPVTVLDHHILRDKDWKRTTQPVLNKASDVGHKVLTAAEYAGEENTLLEAQRKSLYETDPPSKEFAEWAKIVVRKRDLAPPPL